MNVGNPRHKNTVSGLVLCCHDRGMLAKSATIWLSGRHVANILATFPAKPMLMNALYMQYHLQHQNTHYHVHCPTPDRTLLVQNRQRALVFHLRHIILLQLRLGSQDLISFSNAKWVRYYVCQMPLRLSIDNGPVNIASYNAC